MLMAATQKKVEITAASEDTKMLSLKTEVLNDNAMITVEASVLGC